MARSSLFCIASCFLCVSSAASQQSSVEIHIKLINGLNGHPWKLTDVGLEVSPGYRELAVKTDENGVATVSVQKDSTIFTHNTKRYVACVDEAGGLIHNDFKVRPNTLNGHRPAGRKAKSLQHYHRHSGPGRTGDFRASMEVP